MKYKVLIGAFLFGIIYFFPCLAGRCQDSGVRVDSSLLRKISIAPFTLCRTTVSDLRQMSNDFTEVEVEEMDQGKLLKDNFEGDLLAVDEVSFVSLAIITEKELSRDHHVDGRTYGVVIRTNKNIK
jgi:hypothetical protein